jgi:predicted metal-binding protein
MNHQHTLFVCTVCGGQPATDGDQRHGEKLLQQLQTLHPVVTPDGFVIQPVKCMGVCDRPCAIAFVAAGKFTYLFGDLSMDEAELPYTAATVLDCMGQYCAHPDGLLPYRERPELLRDRIIAKIPTHPSLGQ